MIGGHSLTTSLLRGSPFEKAFRLEGLHDFQRGEGVVGGVEQLGGAELGERPIAGGDGFGFLEALLE